MAKDFIDHCLVYHYPLTDGTVLEAHALFRYQKIYWHLLGKPSIDYNPTSIFQSLAALSAAKPKSQKLTSAVYEQYQTALDLYTDKTGLPRVRYPVQAPAKIFQSLISELFTKVWRHNLSDLSRLKSNVVLNQLTDWQFSTAYCLTSETAIHLQPYSTSNFFIERAQLMALRPFQPMIPEPLLNPVMESTRYKTVCSTIWHAVGSTSTEFYYAESIDQTYNFFLDIAGQPLRSLPYDPENESMADLLTYLKYSSLFDPIETWTRAVTRSEVVSLDNPVPKKFQHPINLADYIPPKASMEYIESVLNARDGKPKLKAVAA